MLTFEEFFTKKKIDLVQLQQAEPALFAEFKKDFEPMGEKSFDHTKKFWFNKLRRLYHLKEEPKPAKTEIEVTEIASQAEPLESPTIEQKPAYTPRFKPSVAVKPADTPAAEVSDPVKEITEEKPKPAYQPRFKMQSIPKEEKPEDAIIQQPEEPAEQAQPKPAAYKPKFNMKNIKPKSEE